MPPLHVEQKEENFACAFTGKAVRFAEMMTQEGWDCVFYHNGETDVTCCETQQILSTDDYWRERRLMEQNDKAYLSLPLLDYYGSFVQASLAPTKDRVRKHITSDQDIFCHTFGAVWLTLADEFNNQLHVETGIGYGHPWAKYRIYESYAWMTHLSGAAGKYHQSSYDFVIPNYYRQEDWKLLEHQNYVLWGNRIQEDKGINVLYEIARAMPETAFVVAGVGVPPPGLLELKNVFHVGVLTKENRKEVWSRAMCTIMPTIYFEPFGGFHVEGMMCGVPALTSDFGVFSETVIPGVNGYRCKTLGDWIKALSLVKNLDRERIQQIARSKYSYEAVGHKYTKTFNQLLDLYGNGWMDTTKSHYVDQQEADALTNVGNYTINRG